MSPGELGPEPHVYLERTDAWDVLDGELTVNLGPEADRAAPASGPSAPCRLT